MVQEVGKIEVGKRPAAFGILLHFNAVALEKLFLRQCLLQLFKRIIMMIMRVMIMVTMLMWGMMMSLKGEVSLGNIASSDK